MSDRTVNIREEELEEPEENVLTQEEHLESILFQFVTLYERWAKDRKVAARQGAEIEKSVQELSTEIEKVVQEFSAEVDRLSRIEDAIIKRLKAILEQTTVTVSKMVEDSVSTAVEEALDGTDDKIQESVSEADHLFSRYQSALDASQWKYIAIAFFSSITTSLLLFWWFTPKPVLPLTETQINTYHNGRILDGFWPKLSTRQQKWLLDLEQGKKTKEKLFEDEKQKYADMSDAEVNKLANDTVQ